MHSDWLFLGRDFAIRTISMETVISSVFFCFRKPSNSNFATKTTKRKRVNALIFAKKLPKRLIFYRAYNKREKDEYSRSEFYYPEDLELQRLDQASAKFGRPQDNFIKNQRSANTNKRMATDLNTLLR